MRQTPRSPAKRSTPHLCSHKMHSLRSFSTLKSFRIVFVTSSQDGGFSVQCFPLPLRFRRDLRQVSAFMLFPDTRHLTPDTQEP
jgi:hypothetical protein